MLRADGALQRTGGERAGKQMPAADLAAADLRSTILEGALVPGEQIRQEELSIQLGVSRNPMREALRMLTGEGLIDYKPNRGFFVARLDADSLDQLYILRRLMETELVQSIQIASVSDEAIDRVRQANQPVIHAIEHGSLRDMVRANRGFHMTLLGLSPLTVVRSELFRIWHRLEYYQALYLAHPAGRNATIHEHEEILKALAAKDVQGLVSLLDNHRAEALNVYRQLLDGRGRSTMHSSHSPSADVPESSPLGASEGPGPRD